LAPTALFAGAATMIPSIAVFDLTAPLRALVVALSGVALAWSWFKEQFVAAVLIALALAAAGAVVDWIGRSLLPARPAAAVRFLEWWILTPAAVAAVASAVVVIVTVALTIPEEPKVDASTKQLIGTLSTGLTAFVTAAFISWAGDDKDSRLAEHIKSAFQAKYTREGTAKPGAHPFAAESSGERWVFSDEYKGIDGWGRDARLKRAAGIAAALKT